MPKVSFLGIVIVSGNVQMDPEKIRVVVDWQHFLGFGNFYRKSIRNLSSIAAQLYALTSPR